MKRLVCAQRIKDRLRPDDLVVCGLGATEAAWKAVDPANLTYYASDPMGTWLAVALGLALARPDRRVLHIAGDGDLIMNLQCLITVASVGPANLRIVVFQDGTYASIGRHRLPGADRLSLAAIATGAGFPWAAEARSEEEACSRLDELLSRPGPGFLAAHLEDDPSPDSPPGPWAQVEERTVFMRRLAAGP
jgi:thiamine pyrophosphate-dependent acetolactate synthase large subunit-like protein